MNGCWAGVLGNNVWVTVNDPKATTPDSSDGWRLTSTADRDFWCPSCERRFLPGEIVRDVDAADIAGTLVTAHVVCRVRPWLSRLVEWWWRRRGVDDDR